MEGETLEVKSTAVYISHDDVDRAHIQSVLGRCDELHIDDTDLVCYEFTATSAKDDIITAARMHRGCLILEGYAGEGFRYYDLTNPRFLTGFDFEQLKKVASKTTLQAYTSGKIRRVIRKYACQLSDDELVRVTNGVYCYEVSPNAYESYQTRRAATAGHPTYLEAFENILLHFAKTRQLMPFVPFGPDGILRPQFKLYEPALLRAGLYPFVSMVCGPKGGYVPETGDDLILAAVARRFRMFRGKKAAEITFDDEIVDARFKALDYKVKCATREHEFMAAVAWADQLEIEYVHAP